MSRFGEKSNSNMVKIKWNTNTTRKRCNKQMLQTYYTGTLMTDCRLLLNVHLLCRFDMALNLPTFWGVEAQWRTQVCGRISCCISQVIIFAVLTGYLNPGNDSTWIISLAPESSSFNRVPILVYKTRSKFTLIYSAFLWKANLNHYAPDSLSPGRLFFNEPLFYIVKHLFN